MSIDPWSPEPIYRQLAAILRERIANGTYAPGTRIPSELTLTQEHGIARDTARAAIRLLRDEGLVVVLPGRGTFVPPED